ncbi:MAG: histidine kinase dimerization/phospho-acceptor domain-containing protein [Pseudomonadota bacterium]
MFRWTLSRELGVFLLAQVAVLVFVYSQLLPQYLWSGIQQAAEVFLRTEAQTADAHFAQYGTLPDSSGHGIQLYEDLDQMPEETRELIMRRGSLPRENRIRFFGDGESGVMLLIHPMEDGSKVFMVFRATEEVIRGPGGVFDEFTELLRLRERVGLGFVAFWGVLTALLLRRIYVRTRRMSQWTQGLSPSSATQDDPRFGYGEFDDVGRELQGAFARISKALERESEFVRNASHELRTPIAIIRSNLDLERRRSGSESEPLGRIRRASDRMQQLVDTLLWLSREDVGEQSAEDVDLEALLRLIADEHAYLLNGKHYRLQVSGPVSSRSVAEQPARIALANLIRNAFQHSDEGEVLIELNDEGVTVQNRIAARAGGDQKVSQSDGLGLTLVRKITQRMGWAFEAYSQGVLHIAKLRFTVAGT